MNITRNIIYIFPFSTNETVFQRVRKLEGRSKKGPKLSRAKSMNESILNFLKCWALTIYAENTYCAVDECSTKEAHFVKIKEEIERLHEVNSFSSSYYLKDSQHAAFDESIYDLDARIENCERPLASKTVMTLGKPPVQRIPGKKHVGLMAMNSKKFTGIPL